MCLTRVAPTELETVGNDSCSIPGEAEKEDTSVCACHETGSLRYWLDQTIFRQISSVTWKYIFCGRR